MTRRWSLPRARRALRYARARWGLWQRPDDVEPSDVRVYAFVLGCSRSGTTSLVRLVNSHPQVAIGMERYKRLIEERGPYRLTPEHFAPQRFFDFREHDTNVRPSSDPRWVSFYDGMRSRWADGTVRVSGDKITPRASILEAIDRNFPEPRFVFILRDVAETASSYVVRAFDATDPEWPAWKDHLQAVRDWNRALRAVDGFIRRHGEERVLTVAYERIFSDDEAVLAALFAHLGLEPTASVRTYRSAQLRDAERIRGKPVRLDTTQLTAVESRARRDLEERFLLRAEQTSQLG